MLGHNASEKPRNNLEYALPEGISEKKKRVLEQSVRKNTPRFLKNMEITEDYNDAPPGTENFRYESRVEAALVSLPEGQGYATAKIAEGGFSDVYRMRTLDGERRILKVVNTERLTQGGSRDALRFYLDSLERGPQYSAAVADILHNELIRTKQYGHFPNFRKGHQMFGTGSNTSSDSIHPKMVTANEIKKYAITLEEVEGETLESVLQKARDGEDLPARRRLQILRDIASSIATMHENKFTDGIKPDVGGDEKPANYLLTASGVVKIDLAFLMVGNDQLPLTPRERFAPEQYFDLQDIWVDVATDSWQYGLIMYELLDKSGQLPAVLTEPIMDGKKKKPLDTGGLSEEIVERIYKDIDPHPNIRQLGEDCEKLANRMRFHVEFYAENRPELKHTVEFLDGIIAKFPR